MLHLHLAMSMVEVMVGIVLLSLIVIPSLQVIVGETRTVTSTRDNVMASTVAQQIMEKARTFQFSLQAEDDYSKPSDLPMRKRTYEWQLKNLPSENQIKINNVLFKIKEVRIDPIGNKHDPNSQKILNLFSFAVEYSPGGGEVHSLDVETALPRQ